MPLPKDPPNLKPARLVKKATLPIHGIYNCNCNYQISLLMPILQPFQIIMYSNISLHHGFRNSQLVAFWCVWSRLQWILGVLPAMLNIPLMLKCHFRWCWNSNRIPNHTSRDSNRDTFGAWSSSLCWQWWEFKVILTWNCNFLNVSINVDMMLYSCHRALKWKLQSGEKAPPSTWTYIKYILAKNNCICCMFLLSWHWLLTFELDRANLPPWTKPCKHL